MLVAVTADGDSLSSYVSDDFGHAPFVIISDDSMNYRTIVNEFADAIGAGMKTAEAIVSLNVNAVITGGIGGHGYNILSKSGIKVCFDEEGTVEECLKKFFEKNQTPL